MTEKRRLVFYLFLTAFVTNLIWENMQAPLYIGYKSFEQHFLFCLAASLIDAAVILAFYFIVMLMRKDALWPLNIQPADTLALLAMGLVTAILFERWALESGRWDYTDEMPVVLGIGLAPLIQLGILSIISVYLVKIAMERRVARHN